MDQDITTKADLCALLSQELLEQSDVVNRDLDRRMTLLFSVAAQIDATESIEQIADFLLETYKAIHVMHGHYIFGVTDSGGMVLLLNTEGVTIHNDVKSL